MKIVYLIFGGWTFLIMGFIWGFIFNLIGLKDMGESYKGIFEFVLNPQGFDRAGELGDNTVFNVICLLFLGGLVFLIHGMIWGIILGLFDKELGASIKNGAMGGLSMAVNKWTAKA